jgi:dTDP-4-dehydrorhamnose reductase
MTLNRGKKILLTGGSGALGGALLQSSLRHRITYSPTHKELEITNFEQVKSYLDKIDIDTIIHCAALADVTGCEKNPEGAINVNIGGTSSIVECVRNKKVRFIYISTDYVYPCERGNYSEKDAVGPFTVYGWTKLAGEYIAGTLKDHCIIRTSFFIPEKISYESAPNDAYFSKISLSELVEAIIFLLDSSFVGTVNVGQERASIYDILKKYKPGLKAKSRKEIQFTRAVDSSFDISLWKAIQNKKSGFRKASISKQLS